MSYRFKINDFEVLSDHTPMNTLEELRHQGCDISKDLMFDNFSIKDINSFLEALNSDVIGFLKAKETKMEKDKMLLAALENSHKDSVKNDIDILKRNIEIANRQEHLKDIRNKIIEEESFISSWMQGYLLVSSKPELIMYNVMNILNPFIKESSKDGKAYYIIKEGKEVFVSAS